MSDASLIAGQLQDVSTSIDDVAGAIRNRPDPTIKVEFPKQEPAVINVTAAPPTIVVEASRSDTPIVNVASPINQFDPTINIEAQPPVTYNVRITGRTKDGYITAFTITPVSK